MKTKLSIGVPIVELTRRVLSSGGISVKGILLLAVYYLKLMLVMPVAFLQSLIYSRRINKTIVHKQPVFILGYYRSGTTYLHKLLAADKRFGFITYYDMICPNSSLIFGKRLKNVLQFFINKFKIRTSFFNNTIPQLDEPAEEERFLINKGSAYTDYWRYVFPLCWDKWPSCAELCNDPAYHRRWQKEYMRTLKLASFKNKGKQLILKSPPNTERIKFILQMFPDAKFIYIRRNPYHVFYSACNLWQKVIRKFSLQKLTTRQLEENIFNSYSHMMEQYEESKKLIPGGNLAEVRYEELESKSIATLKEIYSVLNLPAFETAQKEFERQLEKEKQYNKFVYRYDKETFSRIQKKWEKYIVQWDEKKNEVHEYA